MHRRSGVFVETPLSRQARWTTLLRLAQVKEARERRRTEARHTRRAGVYRSACPSCEIDLGDHTRASIRPAAVPLRDVREGVDTRARVNVRGCSAACEAYSSENPCSQPLEIPGAQQVDSGERYERDPSLRPPPHSLAQD